MAQLLQLNKQRFTPINNEVLAWAATDGDIFIIIDNSAIVGNLTVPLPSTPIDGQIFQISCRGGIRNLTITSNGIPIRGGVITLYPGNMTGWIYDTASNAWFTYIPNITNEAGVSEFADNAAALLGGLTIGMKYRTGDFLKIVH